MYICVYVTKHSFPLLSINNDTNNNLVWNNLFYVVAVLGFGLEGSGPGQEAQRMQQAPGVPRRTEAQLGQMGLGNPGTAEEVAHLARNLRHPRNGGAGPWRGGADHQGPIRNPELPENSRPAPAPAHVLPAWHSSRRHRRRLHVEIRPRRNANLGLRNRNYRRIRTQRDSGASEHRGQLRVVRWVVRDGGRGGQLVVSAAGVVLRGVFRWVISAIGLLPHPEWNHFVHGLKSKTGWFFSSQHVGFTSVINGCFAISAVTTTVCIIFHTSLHILLYLLTHLALATSLSFFLLSPYCTELQMWSVH